MKFFMHFCRLTANQSFVIRSCSLNTLTSLPVAEVDDVSKRLQLLKYHVEIFKQADVDMPSEVDDSQFNEMLKMNLKQRIQYLWFLGQREARREITVQRKAQINADFEAERLKVYNRLKEQNSALDYTLDDNCIHTVNYLTQTHFRSHKLVRAYAVDPPLLVDMSFVPHLPQREQQYTLRQVQAAYKQIKLHCSPLGMQLTNCQFDSDWFSHLCTKRIVDLTTGAEGFLPFSPPLLVTEKHYLDMYPPSKLCYISRHANKPLVKFDSDRVYVVQALADKSSKLANTLQEPLEAGVETCHIPLKFAVKLIRAPKTIPLGYTVEILLEAHRTNNMIKSIQKCLPERYVTPVVNPENKTRRLDRERQLRYLMTLVDAV